MLNTFLKEFDKLEFLLFLNKTKIIKDRFKHFFDKNKNEFLLNL